MASHLAKEVRIDIYGEGKTDVGDRQNADGLSLPNQGVIPILVYRLCGEPPRMRVRRYGMPFQMKAKGGLQEKSRLAKMQSRDQKADALVFVVDADGDDAFRKAKWDQLDTGRNRVPNGPPMAVGVAQPCIEAWLIVHFWPKSAPTTGGASLSGPSNVLASYSSPEDLPGDSADSAHPKRVLAALRNQQTQDLDAKEKWEIARQVDLQEIEQKCPKSFLPFAQEVHGNIAPLFGRFLSEIGF